MQLGLFTDIHFQPQGLDRIIKTGNWIIEEFKRQEVQAVVCMGDSLVTREEVDVVAQSAAINFFRRLADQWPVFVTLGNHDLNLKHSTSVSSLDALDMHPRIKVFRDITLVGDRFLFLPYLEDQTRIVSWVQDYARQNPEKAKNITVFGHLSLNGAVQNTKYGTTFAGAIGPDLFAPFKRTYSGHFHVHNEMANRVTYVGSPLQFNFGDAGDPRGIMVLDPDTGVDRFVLNPYHDAFKVIAAKDLIGEGAPEYRMESLEGCFVTVIYDDIVTEDQHESLCKQLEACGVISVKKESVVEKAIREHTVEVDGVKAATAVDLVEPFVKSVLSADSQLDQATAIAFGKAIITEVNAGFQNVADTGAIFEGDITDIFITKFLGVNGTIHIKMADLAKGIWYFEGANGAGKSTILEAIFWCYFGEFIRSETKADDAVFDPHETGKGKDCEVTVAHANGWSMTRYRKHSKHGTVGVKVFKDGFYREDFEKGDPKATQKAINDLLGTNAENFVRSNIMGQNITANFITGDEKKRRQMIEEMLGLERFDAYLEKTREYKKTINDQMEQQDSIQRIRAGEIERSAGQVSSVDVQILDAEKAHQESIDALAQWEVDNEAAHSNQRAKIQEAIVAAENAVKAADQNWNVAAEEHQQIVGGDAAIRAEANVEQDLATEAQATITRINASVEALHSTLANIENDRKATATSVEVNKAKITQIEAALALEPKCLEAQKVAQGYRDNANTADAVTIECRATAASLKAQADPLVTEVSRLAGLTASNCPNCLQPVDKAGLDTIIAGKKAAIVALDEKRNEMLGAAQKSQTFAAQLRADADAHLAGVPTIAQLDAAKAMLTSIKATNAGLEATLTKLVPAQIAAAYEAFHKRLMVDLPGYHWSSTDPIEVQKVIDTLTKDRNDRTANAQTILARCEPAKVEEIKQALQKAESALNVVKEALTTLRHHQAAVEAENRATVAAKAAQLANLRATDPSAALKVTRERLVADRAKALAEMEAAKTSAHALSQKAAYVTFWDRAFAAKGSMRSFLLDQSVQQLNTVVSGFISQHFGGRMKLTFNSDLTFKERYGRRSGGQRKWTDLAALFSLFEVSRQRSRYRSHWMGLDEVFDALDVQGRQAVLDLINSIAGQVDRIFMITHVAVPGAQKVGTIQATMPDLDTGTLLTVKPV